MKLHLQSTDYGKLLSSSEGDLTVSLVDSKLRENLVAEFSCLRSNALPPLSTFLDYITYAATLHVVLMFLSWVLSLKTFCFCEESIR